MGGKMRRALFPYFGSKVRLSAKYDPPQYKTIIEPFAGSAGYAMRFADNHEVVLIEKCREVWSVWDWYLSASRQDVLDLPLLRLGECVDKFDLPEGARNLIGFWLVRGSATPRRCLKSRWVENYPDRFWGEHIRQVLADQIGRFDGWRVILGDYSDAPDIEASWFIDPPYQEAGKSYIESKIDYGELGTWCQTRKGQIQVCEQNGADWLPFHPLYSMSNMQRSKRVEVVWKRGSTLI